MGVKKAIMILHIIQSNLMVKLVQTFDEREIKAISGQIKALDMAIISLKEKKENDMVIKATESGFNQTVRKNQVTIIAELISRVTSLEETVEFILEHSPITEQTEVCDECIYVKGSQWCDKCDGKPKRVV